MSSSTLDRYRSKPTQERAVYTVQEVAHLLGLALGGTYTLIREGTIPAIKVRGRWVVPKKRFHARLDGIEDQADDPIRPAAAMFRQLVWAVAVMGHVVKTAAGNFRANWRDAAGTQRAKTFNTKREANSFLAEVESSLRRRSAGSPDPRPRSTVTQDPSRAV